MRKAEFLNSMMEMAYFCEEKTMAQWYNDRYGFLYITTPKSYDKMLLEAKILLDYYERHPVQHSM